VVHSNKGRIHLRRPTCDILTFRLRRSGGPYISAQQRGRSRHRIGPKSDREVYGDTVIPTAKVCTSRLVLSGRVRTRLIGT
jgi:hypothetical protein